MDLVAALVRRKRILDARNVLDRAAWRARGFEVSVLGAGTRAGIPTEASEPSSV